MRKSQRRRFLVTVTVVASGWIPTSHAIAQPGQPDATFGAGGKMTTSFSDLTRGEAIAAQPDGKLVVAGRTAGASGPATGDFAVARYSSNGSPDDSFGVGGGDHGLLWVR